MGRKSFMLTGRQIRIEQQKNRKAKRDRSKLDDEILELKEKNSDALVDSAENKKDGSDEPNAKQAEEQKKIEEQLNKEFLPDFKADLSKKYKTLISKIEQEIDRTELAKKNLASFYDNCAMLYRSQFYSSDVFILAADYYKDKKESDKVFFLDHIKKDAPLSVTVDMFSQSVEELQKLKSDIEQHEKKQIEEYKRKIILSLQKWEDIKRNCSIQLDAEVDSIKQIVIAAIRKVKSSYYESKHFQEKLTKDHDSALEKYNLKFGAFDDSAQEKSLDEVEKLFNHIMRQCEHLRGWSSLAEDLLIKAANELASKKHIKFIKGRLFIDPEQLIKDRVIEAEKESIAAKQSSIKKNILSESTAAIKDFDNRLQVKIERTNKDSETSSAIQMVAPRIRDELNTEAGKINASLNDKARACIIKLKEVDDILLSAQAKIKEVYARFEEKQLSFLRCAVEGTLEEGDIDFEDMDQKSLYIESDESELAQAKFLLKKNETQELKSQSTVGYLYDTALDQLEKARNSLGGTVYQENNKKPKHYQKVFNDIAEKIAAQKLSLHKKEDRWKKISNKMAALKTYARGAALTYSKFNKNRIDFFNECKITDSHVKTIAAEKLRAITTIKNAIDQNRFGDLREVQTILENAKKYQQFAEVSFAKATRIVENAERNKLAAETQFNDAQKLHPSVSFARHQIIADATNAQYNAALKEKNRIEAQLKHANQIVDELKTYAFCADECVKLNKTLDQIIADKVELEAVCEKLDKISTDVDMGEIRKILPQDVETTNVKDHALEEKEAKQPVSQAGESVHNKIEDLSPIDAIPAERINKKIDPCGLEEKEARQPVSQVVKRANKKIEDIVSIDDKLTGIIHKKIDPFVKADALLNRQNIRRQEFLVAFNRLKDAIGDKEQEEKNHASFTHQEAQNPSQSNNVMYQFRQCLSAIEIRETHIPKHEQNESLKKVLDKAIPEHIINNHLNAVRMIEWEKKKAEEERIANERKKAEEDRRAEEKKIVDYLKTFLEKNEDHLHAEVVGGTKLKGRHVKVQARIAGIYTVLLEKKHPFDKLQEVKDKIAARLQRKSFFSTEGGFADLLSKAIQKILNQERYNFDDVKKELEKVRSMFVDDSLQPLIEKSHKK